MDRSFYEKKSTGGKLKKVLVSTVHVIFCLCRLFFVYLRFGLCGFRRHRGLSLNVWTVVLWVFVTCGHFSAAFCPVGLCPIGFCLVEYSLFKSLNFYTLLYIFFQAIPYHIWLISSKSFFLRILFILILFF